MNLVRTIVCCALFGMSTALGTGCEKQTPKAASKESAGAKDHDHGHEHDGHDAHDEHGEEHGSDVSLGAVQIGAWEFGVMRGKDLKAGGEAHVDLRITGATENIAAIRAWIGVEDGSGSMKAKAEGSGTERHLHVEAPNPIPTGAKLWIEVEDSKGAKQVGSVDLKM